MGFLDFFNKNEAKSYGELGIGNPGSYGGKTLQPMMYDSTGFDWSKPFENFDLGGFVKGAGTVGGLIGDYFKLQNQKENTELGKQQLALQDKYAMENLSMKKAEVNRDLARQASNTRAKLS